MTNDTYALVYPMLAMFLWTFLIMLRNVQVRVSAVLRGQLSNEYFELFRGVRAIRSYLENRKSLEKPDGNAAALLHRDACHQKRGAAEAARLGWDSGLQRFEFRQPDVRRLLFKEDGNFHAELYIFDAAADHVADHARTFFEIDPGNDIGNIWFKGFGCRATDHLTNHRE